MFEKEPVSRSIAKRIGPTLLLSGTSLFLAYFLSVPLGLYFSARSGKLDERTLSLGMYMLYSLPSFVAALMLLTLFYQKLRGTMWELPLQGMYQQQLCRVVPAGQTDRHWPPPDLAAGLPHLRRTRLRQPVHQGQHGRSHAAGLHSHGPGQRRELLADHRRSRLSQYAHSIRHAARPVAPRTAQRRGDSGRHFRLAGHGAACSSIRSVVATTTRSWA